MTEIEEKLQRDSMTIKEQIMNLQNTIKKFKADMLGSSQKKTELDVNEKKIKNVYKEEEDNHNINKNESKEDINEDDNVINNDKYLKFSFNNKQFVEQNKSNHREEYEDEEEENAKNENENYNYTNSKNGFTNSIGNVNYRDSNASFKASTNNNYDNYSNYTSSNRIKANIKNFSYEPMNQEEYNEYENEEDKIIRNEKIKSKTIPSKRNEFEERDKVRIYNKYIDTNTTNNDNDDELQLEDLSRENSNKKKQNYISFNYKKNVVNNDDDNDSSFSLDEKIKKLQKKKFTLESPAVPKPKNKIIKNSLIRPKSTQKLFHTNVNSTRNLHTPSTSKSNVYSVNKKKISNEDNAKRIKSYQNEIMQLKSTIQKLKNENQKLKIHLQKEKTQNEKYRQLTEEIIKHYEKTKKFK